MGLLAHARQGGAAPLFLKSHASALLHSSQLLCLGVSAVRGQLSQLHRLLLALHFISRVAVKSWGSVFTTASHIHIDDGTFEPVFISMLPDVDVERNSVVPRLLHPDV